MAQAPPPANDRKRVKVYELKSNDWFDRGTGFCTGSIVNDEARIHVQSEDDPDRTLLETRIAKEDGYQKQQDTLIVWTEQNGTDMALSFQEAEGCGAIWDFVSEAQGRLGGLVGADDGLSDDVMEAVQPIMLPPPELQNLPDIENMMRAANTSAAGRDALTKFIMGTGYIGKLVPLVDMAEDLESLTDLHRLCNIMKTIILLNDTAIIEHVVGDDVVLGVVGALEYDPDFPSHKANHRQYLSDGSRFKEVVKIDDPNITSKIHYTYRLQYLKDVVLARILDDPTFSVLNSLIFFHQVDIVQHLQSNAAFLRELFSIFNAPYVDAQRKKDGVQFIQQCCLVAKGLQVQARNTLYQNFISNGLFQVITFALRHTDASIRVAGTDILVALIDHDALMMRGHIFKAINEGAKPLTDTLIELLLKETDLGVKAQMADAIKVLLDPNANVASIENIGRTSSEYLAKVRTALPPAPHTDSFIQKFYDDSAKKLFQPLKELENRESVAELTPSEVSLYSHLVEVLCFFIRQHSFRSKYFILSEGLASRVAQLLRCPEKHLKLTALKYFRTCIGLHDEFHNRQIVQHRLLDPIIDIVYETMPKDNLLNSACLDFFEFIKRESVKALIIHLGECHRERLEKITYVDIFQSIIVKYDQIQTGYTGPETSQESDQTESVNGRVLINSAHRWGQGLRDADAEEEAYFNSEDNDDEENLPTTPVRSNVNGASPVRPLVNYPDDDDENAMDILATPETTSPDGPVDTKLPSQPVPSQPLSNPPPKRRRVEDEDDDELGKLALQPKRRNSVSSTSSNSSGKSTTSNNENTSKGPFLRRKGSINSGKDGPPKKISISLSLKGSSGGASGAGSSGDSE